MGIALEVRLFSVPLGRFMIGEYGDAETLFRPKIPA